MTRLFKYINVVALLLMTSVTYAETNDCTAIESLPYFITKSGVYCLTGNLQSKRTGGGLIKIQSNGVTIDLNGWTLDGSSAGPATNARGIFSYKRSNVTIRNGTIRGFYKGIELVEPNPYMFSQGNLVENVQVENSIFSGIHITGSHCTVRNNKVTDTGNSTSNLGLRAYGIQVYGFGARVMGNDISSTTADSRSDGYGLVLGTADSSIVIGNRINNVATGTGNAYGIYVSSSDNLLLRDNNLINMMNGIYYSNSTGRNMNNFTANVDVPFTGGDLVGIND